MIQAHPSPAFPHHALFKKKSCRRLSTRPSPPGRRTHVDVAPSSSAPWQLQARVPPDPARKPEHCLEVQEQVRSPKQWIDAHRSDEPICGFFRRCLRTCSCDFQFPVFCMIDLKSSAENHFGLELPICHALHFRRIAIPDD